MSEKRLLVYGAGGHAKVVADAALSSGWTVVGFLDADPQKEGQHLLGLPIYVASDQCIETVCQRQGAQIVVAIGSNATRRTIYQSCKDRGLTVATVVHASAVIARSASLGEGTVAFANSVVNPGAMVGRNVILNTSASVDHDNIIGDHAHLSPGVHLGGTVEIGEGTHVGIGSTIRNNITVGAWSVVGAGASVVRHLPDYVVAFGVPARVMRELRL